ncbi:hypothetical protein ACFU7T_01135 [Streptomyces sp. NPDC057555]
MTGGTSAAALAGGAAGTPVAEVAQAYVRAVEGQRRGQVIRP